MITRTTRRAPRSFSTPLTSSHSHLAAGMHKLIFHRPQHAEKISRVSEYLMGDLDVANLPFTSAVCSKTKSYETLMGRAASARGRASGVDDCGPAGEQESELLKIEHSVEALLRRAKLCSKYLKDVVTYVEKRAHLDLEYSKNLAKLAQTIKPLISEEVRKYFVEQRTEK
jgi:Fes/CIP4, and EFC/F-BAR homology domain